MVSPRFDQPAIRVVRMPDEALRDDWNQRKFRLDELWRRARLEQHTDTAKQDFNLTPIRYGLEHLLYRP